MEANRRGPGGYNDECADGRHVRLMRICSATFLWGKQLGAWWAAGDKQTVGGKCLNWMGWDASPSEPVVPVRSASNDGQARAHIGSQSLADQDCRCVCMCYVRVYASM